MDGQQRFSGPTDSTAAGTSTGGVAVLVAVDSLNAFNKFKQLFRWHDKTCILKLQAQKWNPSSWDHALSNELDEEDG